MFSLKVPQMGHFLRKGLTLSENKFWVTQITLESVKFPYEQRSCVDLFGFFLMRWVPHWDPRTQAHWPIALYLSFKFIGGYLGVQPPYRGRRSRSASPLLFVLDLSGQNPKSASLPFPKPCICIECVPTFPFLHRISCMREPLLFSSSAACTADWYARLEDLATFCKCFLSSLLKNWTYPSVGLSRHRWPVSYFSRTFHSICLLFSIQFLILDLNLLKDDGRKGSGPIGLVLAPSLASLFTLFCTEFNAHELLFEAFLDITRIFGSIEH